MKTKVKVTLSLLLAAAVYYAFVQGHMSSKVQSGVRHAETGTTCVASPGQFVESRPLEAVVGSDVTLPCHTRFPVNGDDILEWTKGDEIYVIKAESVEITKDYKDRINASVANLRKGNASFILFGVKLSDTGDYCCCIKLMPTEMLKCTNVTLDVRKEEPRSRTESPDGRIVQTTAAPTTVGTIVAVVAGVAVVVAVVAAVVGSIAVYRYQKR